MTKDDNKHIKEAKAALEIWQMRDTEMMDDLDFYNIVADPVNKLTQETIAALVALFHRVEKLEKLIAQGGK